MCSRCAAARVQRALPFPDGDENACRSRSLQSACMIQQWRSVVSWPSSHVSVQALSYLAQAAVQRCCVASASRSQVFLTTRQLCARAGAAGRVTRQAQRAPIKCNRMARMARLKFGRGRVIRIRCNDDEPRAVRHVSGARANSVHLKDSAVKGPMRPREQI